MKNASPDTSRRTKQFVDIVWRRKLWAIVPAVAAVAASAALVVTTPKTYRASTTILVTRQGVPQNLVRSTVTLRIEERMRTLELQVLSRAYLEQIGRKFGMISANASDARIEDACRTLRRQIVPELDKRDYSWFRISVEDVDPVRAAGIANELAALFIDQNSRMRTTQAAGTLETTQDWEQGYRLELAKRDAEISAFKRNHLYDLPDQQPANLELLNGAQTRLALLTSQIESRNDHLVALRGQQQQQRAIGTVLGAPGFALGGGDSRLAVAQRELEELLSNYTEANPLVKRKRAQIAQLVRSLPPAPAPGSPVGPANAAGLDPLSVRIATVENEIRGLQRDRASENATMETYRARIGSAPLLQPRLLELTRDYDQVKHEYEMAGAQKEQAQHSQDLEASGNGEQFQIQDRAHPPTAPYKPNALRYLMAGLALGLALGAGAIAAREFVDQTVRCEEEFAALFPDLPVCGVIPSLDARAGGHYGSVA